MNSMVQLPFPKWVPKEIVAGYRDKGIAGLFQWQLDILTTATETHDNVIYAAPTSAGKSLVAELLALHAALHEKKSFFVLPYVAVAKEKLNQLQKIWRRIDLQVAGYMGHQSSERSDWLCAICTIEKANSLVNRMITEDKVDDLGVIVLDELHMVNEISRGMTYEFFIAKILFLQKQTSVARIVAMSATLSNTSKIENWLGSPLYQTDFRPIDLTETISIESDLWDIEANTKLRELPKEFQFPQDHDRVIGWTVEAVCTGNLCLVFCSSKAEVERLAVEIARMVAGFLNRRPELQGLIDRSALFELKTELERIGPIDSFLMKTLPRGIGFHHAGLTAEERECLENFFRRGIIRVLVATSTLSSGVNLPANKVIIRAQTRGPASINSMTYKQMAGRAGRMGHATKGESILSTRKGEVDRVRQLISQDENFVYDMPRDPGKLVLEAICSRLCRHMHDVVSLLGFLLNTPLRTANKVIDDLVQLQFVSRREKDDDTIELEPTQLGAAALASSLPPDAALQVFSDLERAQKALCLNTELHMLYLVTPLNLSIWAGSDWNRLHKIYTALGDDLIRVARVVGVNEGTILSYINGSSRCEDRRRIHERFFSSLALFEVINEAPIAEVAVKFGITRGALQTLQQQSATYAAMVVAFCARLGWVYLKALLEGFASRLAFGVRRELTELVRLEGIDGARARAFHVAGITSISRLANADPKDITLVLTSVVPFENSSERQGMGEWLFGGGLMRLEEAVGLLIERANHIMTDQIRELGLLPESQIKEMKVRGEKRLLAQQNQISQVVTDAIRLNTQHPAIGDSNIQNIDTDWNNMEKPEECVETITTKDSVNVFDSCSSRRSQKEVSSLNVSKFENNEICGENYDNNDRSNHSTCHLNDLSTNEDTSSIDLFSQSIANLTIDEKQDRMTSFGSPYEQRGPNNLQKSERELLEEIRQSQLFLLGEAEDLETTLAKIKRPLKPFAVNQELTNECRISELENNKENKENFVDSFDLSFDAMFKNLKTKRRSSPKKQEVLRRSLLLKQIPSIKHQSSFVESNEETFISPKSNLSSDPKATLDKRELNDSCDLFATSFSTIDSPKEKKCAEVQKPCKRFFNKMDLPHSPSTSSPIAKISKSSKIPELETQSKNDLILINCNSIEKAKIEDVCCSLKSWKKFINDCENWQECGLACAFRSSSEGEIITGIALYAIGEQIAWISLSDEDFTGNEDEELLAPTLTQLDSITIKQKITVLSYILRRCKRVFVFDLSRIVKAALNRDSFLQIEHPFDVTYAAYLAKSRSDDQNVQFGQLVKTYARTLFPLLNFNDYLGTTSIRIFSSFQALVLPGLYIKCRMDAIQRHNETIFDLEMKALAAGSRLTAYGIYFDKKLCEERLPQMKERLEYISCQCADYAGRSIDVESSREIAALLFDSLKLPYPGKKTKHGQRSTSREILEAIIELHPLPALLIEYRRISYSISNHIRPMMRCITSSSTVHPSYDFLTLTGRMLTNHPNVQNVARDKLFEDFSMRSLFRPRPGHIFVAADYSQLEFRILAHMSGEKTLCEIFRDAGKDIFQEMASEMGYTRKEVKTLCYGIIYGMGAEALSERLACSKDLAQKLIQAFFAKYKKINTYISNIKEIYHIKKCDDSANKFVSTVLGRKRYINVKKGTQSEIAADQRQSINFTIQGTASEIFKRALLTLEEKLKEIQGHLVLTIHDEVICEVPIAAKEHAHGIIRDCLENSLTLSVPLSVKTVEGYSWQELSP